jgi:predicted DNA-binding protein (MmcQ/YjbR family)
MGNMDRLERIVARLPDVVRVDIEAWGGEPTFRVAGKNFIFAGNDGRTITVKLTIDEAAAVIATDPQVVPAGYGPGRAGWVSITLTSRPSASRWREVEEWIRTSYTLVAPKRLARQVLEQDQRAISEFSRRRPKEL